MSWKVVNENDTKANNTWYFAIQFNTDTIKIKCQVREAIDINSLSLSNMFVVAIEW